MTAPGAYAVQYDVRAVKELGKLDKHAARRVVAAAEALRTDPRPAGCRALTGYPGLWRIRIGNYRVIYTINDAELVILVLRVAHRSTAYRRL